MGPCAKVRVRCTITTPSGEQFVGENVCQSPQDTCPREEGEGYEKCQSICRQLGHAEAVAAYLAGDAAKGGWALLEGHTYACDPCKAALASIGVTKIVVSDA